MFSQNKIKLDEKQEKIYIDNLSNEIKTLAKKKCIHVDVTWRLKSIDSIQKKMQYKKVSSLDKIYDIRGIRIICDNNSDCYTLLNIIHTNWKHIPTEFSDFIKNPKKNGYQSLHTVIYGSKGKTTEIQIKTHEILKNDKETHQEYKNMKYKKKNIILDIVLELFTMYLKRKEK